MRAVYKTLKSRIFLCVFFAGAFSALVLFGAFFLSYESNLIEERTIEIRQKCNVISTKLGESKDIQTALNEENSAILNWYSEAFGGRILLVDPDYKILFDTFSNDQGKTCISDAVFSAFSGDEYSEYKKSVSDIEFVFPISHTFGETEEITGVLIFSSTTEWISNGLRKVVRGMWMILTVVLFLILIFAVHIAFIILKPVKELKGEMQKLSSGDMEIDLSEKRSYSEFDEILDHVTETIQDYQKMEKSQSEFISNVSHELKTPMASIRVLADSLIGQENLSEEIYQEFLGDISVEVDRETRIVEDLLAMSRIGKTADSMNITTVNINDFILDVLKRLRPIAKQREIELIYESFRQVSADVDYMKLGQACTNLIENAIKYNKDAGVVHVSLDADHEYFYLKVQDTGVGIPEDAIEHIFDRFYRVDKARSRDTGGSGLGLYITKTIVLMHYGVIKTESILGEGTCFTMRIPLKHVMPEGGNH